MVRRKFKIYSAIDPNFEKTVSADEYEKYLSCKFWKSSKKEAYIFFCLYFASVPCGSNVVLAMLSGQLFKANNIDGMFDEVDEAIGIYRQNREDKRLLEYSKYKKIMIKADKQGESYPSLGLIDDVISWAQQNEVINIKTAALIEENLANTRQSIFRSEHVVDDSFIIEIVGLLLDREAFIFYNDAQELFFPNKNMQHELKKEKIPALSSFDEEYSYFRTESLLKWLMQNGYVSKQLTNTFRKLKIDSLKENHARYTGRLYSLQSLIQQGGDRGDILNMVLTEDNAIYIKYPRDLLLWRHVYLEEIEKTYAPQRYAGLGQLKKFKTDDCLQCHHGGLTVDMLLYQEDPKHDFTSNTSEQGCNVELVQTEEEAHYGLQPYVKIPYSKLSFIITDDNFVFLDDILSGIVSKASSFNTISTSIRVSNKTKQQRNHGLHDLIKETFVHNRSITNKEMWKKLEQKANDNDLIQAITSWSARSARIVWISQHGNEQTMSKKTFLNIMSYLRTQK